MSVGIHPHTETQERLWRKKVRIEPLAAVFFIFNVQPEKRFVNPVHIRNQPSVIETSRSQDIASCYYCVRTQTAAAHPLDLSAGN